MVEQNKKENFKAPAGKIFKKLAPNIRSLDSNPNGLM